MAAGEDCKNTPMSRLNARISIDFALILTLFVPKYTHIFSLDVELRTHKFRRNTYGQKSSG
jgi:hypothetical protein